MSSFSSLFFTRPKALHSTNREILRNFFDPYRDFFASRRVDLDALSYPENRDVLPAITQTFLSPGENTPRELIDAFRRPRMQHAPL